MFVLIVTRWLTDNGNDLRSRCGRWYIFSRFWYDILISPQDVNNVLIIVAQYFDGTLLGGDRFKHINRVVKNESDAGGLLDAPIPDNKRSRKHK